MIVTEAHAERHPDSFREGEGKCGRRRKRDGFGGEYPVVVGNIRWWWVIYGDGGEYTVVKSDNMVEVAEAGH